jgi:two-component system LytT family response regulator
MNILNANYTDEAKSPIIVLPTCKGLMVIPVQQIIRIQSVSNYSKLFFNPAMGGSKTLVVAKVLRWFQEQTCLFSFVRIHRTHFVNINFIKSYSGGKNSLLLLHNGEILSIARRKKACLAELLNSFNNCFTNESAGISQLNTKKVIAV